MCARPDRRGLYPGAHVGVHICICLACVATMGYVGIWVSEGNHDWKYIPAPGAIAGDPNSEAVYSPLYHMGIVLLILTVILLLVTLLPPSASHSSLASCFDFFFALANTPNSSI